MANIVPEEYDLVVIGTGEGSKFVAWTLARQGWRVAAVERQWIGRPGHAVLIDSFGTFSLGALTL